MVGMRNDRARARARHLLATVYPVPDDAECDRLRQLAIDQIEEAERLETASRGRAAEPQELISAARTRWRGIIFRARLPAPVRSGNDSRPDQPPPLCCKPARCPKFNLGQLAPTSPRSRFYTIY